MATPTISLDAISSLESLGVIAALTFVPGNPEVFPVARRDTEWPVTERSTSYPVKRREVSYEL
jgi:hypothetical protein